MLTARRPFDFDEAHRTDERRFTDTDKLLHKIVTEPVPSTNRRDLPPGLEELLKEKLLAKDPDERFQSMKDVQAAFEAFTNVARRDSEPIPVSSQFGDTPTPTPTPIPGAPGGAKKSGLAWLLAAIVIGGAGTALMFVEPQQSGAAAANHDAAKKVLEDAAGKLGATLDSQAQAALMRAEGIGGLPMLRAAIETDAATLKDMVKDRDVLFKPAPNEVLEIFQVRDAQPTTMLRIPETAAPIAAIRDNQIRVETDGARLQIVVGAPVVNQKGINQGVIALSQPVDLSLIKQQLAPHISAAALLGLDKPLVLVGTAPVTSTLTFPIKTSAQTKLTGLSLAAALETPAAAQTARAPTLQYARFACWGLAGLLLVMFGVSRARRS
jgi:hypothetical protein